MPTKRIPSYRKQKRAGKPALAFAEINGMRRYFGTYAAAESRQRYEQFLAEWKERGCAMPGASPDLRVVELVDKFWAYAQDRYRRPRTPDGKPTTELDLVRRALAVLTDLYADLRAAQFSPLKLKAVRQKMIEKGWCRKVVNDMVHRVRRCFRWGVENEWVPGEAYQKLITVSCLEKYHPGTRETAPVKPVPEHVLTATLPHLAPPVAAMVRLQLLTGARPGEIAIMRACDIDKSNQVWIYRPAWHKTEHHGDDHTREIYIGPKAQLIVQELFKPDLTAYLLSPRDADDWHRKRRHEKRKTPLKYGNRPGTNVKSKAKVKPGNCYTVASYRRAIEHACRIAFPPPESLAKREKETTAKWMARLTAVEKAELKKWWRAHNWHPHQLRHNSATTIRADYGLEMASIILGHKTINTTEIYAEKNMKLARETIQLIG